MYRRSPYRFACECSLGRCTFVCRDLPNVATRIFERWRSLTISEALRETVRNSAPPLVDHINVVDIQVKERGRGRVDAASMTTNPEIFITDGLSASGLLSRRTPA